MFSEKILIKHHTGKYKRRDNNKLQELSFAFK